MIVEQSAISCGVFELHSLGEDMNVKDSLYSAYQQSLEANNVGRPAFYVFSDIIHNNGSGLVKFINKNNLGAVIASPIKINPNTSSRIQMWIWDVDWKAFTKWAHEYDEQNRYSDD